MPITLVADELRDVDRQIEPLAPFARILERSLELVVVSVFA
ncbi:MAG: hypothetical protein ACRDLT_06750 [Solirubrobacteraceae bacterium]